MSSEIINFFNSNFFVAIVTLLAGGVALSVYRKQKLDKKKDAANIILLEIQNAERELSKVKRSTARDNLDQELIVMPSKSWDELKHLFLRDFDRDEWDLIQDFYNKCSSIDDAIKHNNSAFQEDVEQIRANKQKVFAEYAKDYVDEAEKQSSDIDIESFDRVTDNFDKLYMGKQGQFSYTPQKYVDDAKFYLDGLNMNIAETTIGTKLKKIAKVD